MPLLEDQTRLDSCIRHSLFTLHTLTSPDLGPFHKGLTDYRHVFPLPSQLEGQNQAAPPLEGAGCWWNV